VAPFNSCRQPQDDIQRIIHRSSYSRRRRQVANLSLSLSSLSFLRQGYRKVGSGKSITKALPSTTTIIISHGSEVFTGRPGERTSGLDQFEAARLDLRERHSLIVDRRKSAPGHVISLINYRCSSGIDILPAEYVAQL
jgi:hypothetical protein